MLDAVLNAGRGTECHGLNAAPPNSGRRTECYETDAAGPEARFLVQLYQAYMLSLHRLTGDIPRNCISLI